jgi:hypothetical protein
MVLTDREDRVVLRRLDTWLQSTASRLEGNRRGVAGALQPIADPKTSQWGGTREPECNLWASILNYADLDALHAYVAGLPWRFPAAVQLFVMDQEESYFRLFMFRDGRWQQYAPPPPDDADEQHAR